MRGTTRGDTSSLRTASRHAAAMLSLGKIVPTVDAKFVVGCGKWDGVVRYSLILIASRLMLLDQSYHSAIYRQIEYEVCSFTLLNTEKLQPVFEDFRIYLTFNPTFTCKCGPSIPPFLRKWRKKPAAQTRRELIIASNGLYVSTGTAVSQSLNRVT